MEGGYKKTKTQSRINDNNETEMNTTKRVNPQKEAGTELKEYVSDNRRKQEVK